MIRSAWFHVVWLWCVPTYNLLMFVYNSKITSAYICDFTILLWYIIYYKIQAITSQNNKFINRLYNQCYCLQLSSNVLQPGYFLHRRNCVLFFNEGLEVSIHYTFLFLHLALWNTTSRKIRMTWSWLIIFNIN